MKDKLRSQRMAKILSCMLVLAVLQGACALGASAPKPTPLPTSTVLPTVTIAPSPTATNTAIPTLTLTPTPVVAEYSIAILGPMSGDYSVLGMEERNGVMLAIEEWNAKSAASGIRLKAIIKDTQCDPTKAEKMAREAVDKDKARFLIGDVCSSASIAVAKIAQMKQVVEITSTSANPFVTVDDQGETRSFVFRSCMVDPYQGEAMARFALASQFKDVFIAVLPKNPYSFLLAQSFEKAYTAGGGKISGKGSYAEGEKDFSGLLNAISQSGAKYVYIPDYYDVVNLVGLQARARSMGLTLMGGDGWDAPDLNYEALEGAYYTNHFELMDSDRKHIQWRDAYKADYGSSPPVIASLSYEAAGILFTAIQKAGKNEPTLVRDVLEKDTFDALTGPVSFDESHNPRKTAYIYQVTTDGVRFVQKIDPPK